jgi:hypothetical protein
MLPLTRDDIPRVLPPAFDKEVNDLRCKLLTFRLANLTRLKGKTFGNELLEPNLQPRLQEILIPLKAMLNGDQSMVEAMAGFVHRLQDSLYARRQDSNNGKVLAAIIELHEEGADLTSQNIAENISQKEEDTLDLTADKIGRITKKLGFTKERVGKERQRILRWDEDRVKRLTSIYGLKLQPSLSPLKVSQVSLVSAPDTETADTIDLEPVECPPMCPPNIEASPDVKADTMDGADTILEEGNHDRYLTELGMTVGQALSIWEEAGKPIIHLGPGENCFGLEKLLSHRDINERHLEAVKHWLEERQR